MPKLQTTPAPATIQAPKQRSERLNGQQLTDAFGDPIQPSQAAPFGADTIPPTMLIQPELNYLKWLAQNLETDGRIIELGPFLGGSTAALADGAQANPNITKNILSYDAFIVPNVHSPSTKDVYDMYGVQPGTSFRPLYENNIEPYTNLVDVREGWLPGPDDKAKLASVYPEAEPVQLLFIDAAKTWDVHRGVFAAFGPHLKPGATIVQQDILDLGAFWIALHMLHLKDFVEPLDAIHGSPTISFTVTKDLTTALNHLPTQDDYKDPRARNQAWNDLIDFWANTIDPDMAEVFAGHAAMHAISLDDGDSALEWGHRYEAWRRSAQREGVYIAPLWRSFLSNLNTERPAILTNQPRLKALAASVAATEPIETRALTSQRNAFCPLEARAPKWAAAIKRCRSESIESIALYGAGAHTRWLLNGPLSNSTLNIACILDDAPSTTTLHGIPVINTDDADTHLTTIDAILPSSDTLEPKLLDRIRALVEHHPVRVVPVYTAGRPAEDDYQHGCAYTPTVSEQDAHAPRLPQPQSPTTAPHRERLNLPTQRPWCATLDNASHAPEWALGWLAGHESAILWDIIEADQPRTVVEIGTASGVSTALLLRGLHEIGPKDAKVYTFDVANACYFDETKSLGAAAAAMEPDLIHNAEWRRWSDAVDAASTFPPASIDLAFIDGNHAHPNPALDLLALVYAIKPNAWVVLHDIALPDLRDLQGQPYDTASGAQRLYNQWPFKKFCPNATDPAGRNVGAIQMPDDPTRAVDALAAMLAGPYEAEDEVVARVSKAAGIYATPTPAIITNACAPTKATNP